VYFLTFSLLQRGYMVEALCYKPEVAVSIHSEVIEFSSIYLIFLAALWLWG
jgi:hypothetical protein